jgi:phospholipase C
MVNQSNDPAHDALLPNSSCGGGAPLDDIEDRCGYGPRIPLLIISPYAKRNYVLHSLNDASSIIRFIEDNWNLGRIGNGSFDAIAGSLMDAFDFQRSHAERVILDPDTGEATGS